MVELRSSLLTLGRADTSIAGFRREWGLTPLCEAAATFSGYSEGLSRLSLNRSLIGYWLLKKPTAKAAIKRRQ